MFFAKNIVVIIILIGLHSSIGNSQIKKTHPKIDTLTYEINSVRDDIKNDVIYFYKDAFTERKHNLPKAFAFGVNGAAPATFMLLCKYDSIKYDIDSEYQVIKLNYLKVYSLIEQMMLIRNSLMAKHVRYSNELLNFDFWLILSKSNGDYANFRAYGYPDMMTFTVSLIEFNVDKRDYRINIDSRAGKSPYQYLSYSGDITGNIPSNILAAIDFFEVKLPK